MTAADTDSQFLAEWRHLGHAVAVRAVEDYIIVRKKQARLEKINDTSYRYEDQLKYYRKFFESKWFGVICPDYDGYEMFRLLEVRWKKIKNAHRGNRKPVAGGKYYDDLKLPGRQGVYERKRSEWGSGR